jgi:hypothetical protein
MPRGFVIAQFPNPPLIAAIAAGTVSRLASGDLARAAAVVGDVALLVWAVEEITDGANWFRRLLGVGGAALALSPRGTLAGA